MRLTWPKRSRQPDPSPVASPIASPAASPAAPAQTVGLAEPFILDADLLSDVGCVRTNNEDAGRIVRGPELTADAAPGHQRLLVAVADGMGGHNAGEVASALAVETLESAFATFAFDPARQLKQAVLAANQRIYAESEANPERSGMGTTCTALLLQDGWAYSAHVGDSRIYLLRHDGFYLVTEDHSQVMEMVKAGILSLDEARHHPDKNVITRALGRQPEVDVATWPQPMLIQAGDAFLLCSDGLCDVLEDAEMQAVTSTHTAADACEELVRLARTRHASDNITAAVVKLLPIARGDRSPGDPDPLTPRNSHNGSRPTRRVEI